MKVLVTGGAGYIGSHTAHQLIEAGHDVVIVDNLCNGHRWALPEKAEFIQGDVGNPEILDHLFKTHKFDGVLHFAAHHEVRESTVNPFKYYENNTFTALKLFEACRVSGVEKIIFSSTAAVYGEPGVSVISENQPLNPVNPYGNSKMMTEKILKDLSNVPGSSFRYVVLRYFNVAGARLDMKVGQGGRKSFHLVKVLTEALVGIRDQVAIYGTDYPTPDGTCLRDYMHVEDLALAHINALEYLAKGGASETFNVGYGTPFSVREVIDVMRKVANVDLRVVEGPRRAGDPAKLAADPTKIKTVLGWKPKYNDLELICRTALEFERHYQKNLANK